jgi:AAA+ ATPase superfamily predicted ATPase
MANPFKFGSVVDGEFFTDRRKEAEEVATILASSNHLILISPRRFGKSSLINAVMAQTKRPAISIDLQLVVDVQDFAAQLLKRVLKINTWERIKHLIANFRIVPSIELNPMTNTMEVSFQPSVKQPFTTLEDVLNLIEQISENGERTIVVFDEFQEVSSLSPNLSKQLRSVIQYHKHINYVFLGSMESMMTAIFESKKSPFFHFGHLMRLGKLPHPDLYEYLRSRFAQITDRSADVATDILAFTRLHPYYTQQLAFYYWMYLEKNPYSAEALDEVSAALIVAHDKDYESLWNTLSKTDKKLLIALSTQEAISTLSLPSSTAYSALKRLAAKGFVIRNDTYEPEDPFFSRWIAAKR